MIHRPRSNKAGSLLVSADLRAGLREAEDVVDEEQHILTLLVTEVLGHSQSGQGHSGAGAGGLVHLSVHQGDLAANQGDRGGLVTSNQQHQNEFEPAAGAFLPGV